MQQLEQVASHFIGYVCHDDNQVAEQAGKLAQALSATLSDQSLGADVWFACLRVDDELIQIHYDWLSEGFWLTPTGLLANNAEQWQRLLQRLS